MIGNVIITFPMGSRLSQSSSLSSCVLVTSKATEIIVIFSTLYVEIPPIKDFFFAQTSKTIMNFWAHKIFIQCSRILRMRNF